MNAKEYTDAVTRIDEDLLEGALRYGENTKPIHKKNTWKRTLALAACFVLLLTGALVYRHFALRQPISTLPTNNTQTTGIPVKPDETQTTDTTKSDEPQSADQTAVRYTDLTADGKGLLLQKGGGTASIARFSEKWILTADSILIEGTVLQTYIKQYRFTVDAPGKFENAGGRMTILYEPQTVITTVKVTKVWLGDGTVTAGDTVTFENEFLYSDDVFCCREGVTYVLYLEHADEDTLLTGRPHAGGDERLTEGENRRSYEYERGYPYQPAIEKTKDGDYIVPETWESLTAGVTTEVLPELADVNSTNEKEEDLLLNRLKLVKADTFNERMQALSERLQAN